jgi:hypothetical protein
LNILLFTKPAAKIKTKSIYNIRFENKKRDIITIIIVGEYFLTVGLAVKLGKKSQ